MTTVFLSEKQCYVCGSKSRYPFVDLSLNILGSRDLDGRPALINRSSVYLWVQRCDICGYCAPEISKGTPQEAIVINNSQYKEQLANKDYPDTANSFLCHLMIMDHIELFADAGWAAVFAAWICDDNGYVQSAIDCRKKALSLFYKAMEHNQGFAESPAQGQLYLIDLFRRVQDFEKATQLCDIEIKKSHPEKILDLLYFEQQLIEEKDCICHNDNELEESNFDN